MKSRTLGALVVSALAVAATAASPGASPAITSEAHPETLAHARKIRVDINARYRRVPERRLAVIEATTTDAIESFTLLTPDLLGARRESSQPTTGSTSPSAPRAPPAPIRLVALPGPPQTFFPAG